MASSSTRPTAMRSGAPLLAVLLLLLLLALSACAPAL